VEEGALLAVIGPNGAGKSTLFKGIMGLMAPLSGAVDRAFGVRETAYLPQTADIDRSFPINVYDFVAMGLWRRIGPFGAVGAVERELIHDAIATVGLTGFERRPIAALSGGQLQRVLFARLSLQDARLIVLDEPFNAIDDRTVADLVALVSRWHGERRTVLAALHDMDLVSRHFPQTLLMAREPVAWGETGRVLTADNLTKAQRMCEAFEESAVECAVAAE
jgi:zinc/manganese transport system ATP-binding protein